MRLEDGTDDSDRQTWSLYLDVAGQQCDIIDEGPEPAGAIGSNWQSGYTEAEARAFLADRLAEGYDQGSDWAPRF